MQLDQETSGEENLQNRGQGVRDAMSQFRKGMTDTFNRGRGRLYHAITANNRIVQFRIGENGKLILENTVKSLNVHTKKLQDAREKLIKAGKEVPQRAQKHMRQAITGDPNKRIRDHLNEPPQVKMLDKFSFTLGVITITFAEFLIMKLPLWFPTFYASFMLFLFIVRFIMYKQLNFHLFMLDFCYVVNISCMIQSTFFPNNMQWFNANFALSMGPIALAVIVWHNSLVFHSLDKLTSFFLHSFPPMLYHLYRWRLIPSKDIGFNETVPFTEMIGGAVGIYIAWQIFYLFITEIVLSKELEENPDLVTSLRYLTRDKKNVMNKLVHQLCRRFSIIREDEELHPDHFKAKSIFYTTQFIYTTFLMLPSYFIYLNYYVSCFFLGFLYITATWNGASYYIEVFSKRYNLKFEPPTPPSEPVSSGKAQEDSNAKEDEKTDDEEDLDEHYQEALEDLDESQAMELVKLLEEVDREENRE